MSRPVLTNEQLAELGEAPGAAVARHLAAGDELAAVAVVRRMERELHGQLQRYDHWLSSIVGFVSERHGQAGVALLLDATRRCLAVWPVYGPVEAERPASVADRITTGDGVEVYAAWERRWKAHVDLHRDWICSLLSALYRSWGVDELEAVHRHVGGRTMDGLTATVDEPPAERYERFVWLLKGHFSEVALDEHDDRLVIVQDPCGTCGRQARDDRHGPPLELAVVDERHDVTWGEGSTTIYRTHVPVWHVLMAIERLGVPWPVNQCPRGTGDAPCTIVLYQDPRDPQAMSGVPGALGDRLRRAAEHTTGATELDASKEER